MSIDVQRRGKGAVTLACTGAANVRICREARDRLLEVLAESRGLCLDLSGAHSADVAFTQLMTSARGTFGDAGLRFEVVDPDGILGNAIPCTAVARTPKAE